jgi:hypothetical protein
MKKIVLVLFVFIFALISCDTDTGSDTAYSLSGTWKVFNVSTPGGDLDVSFAFSTGQLIAVLYDAGTLTSVGNHSGTIDPVDIDNIASGHSITYTVVSATGNAPSVGTVQKFQIKSINNSSFLMDVDSNNDGTYDMTDLSCVKQ